ncbi:hypothetical protein MACJ_000271 [Theileria orientalis]|uniref:Uncharacterized protein n=1 Tax=Theileria orientalis TaxID=68886 RepID=A0A976M3T0_THEOR|nr:hypothetical protein MACJ_000271 [Theileria orientalis]
MIAYQYQGREGSVRDILRLTKYISCNPRFRNRYDSLKDFIIKKSTWSIKSVFRKVTRVINQVNVVVPIVQNITRQFSRLYNAFYENAMTVDEMSQKIIDKLCAKNISSMQEELKEDERTTKMFKQQVGKVMTEISELKSAKREIAEDSIESATTKQEVISSLNIAIDKLKKEQLYTKLDYVTKRLHHSMRSLLFYEIKYYDAAKLYSTNHSLHVEFINKLPTDLGNLNDNDIVFIRKIMLLLILITYRKSFIAAEMKKIVPSMLFFQEQVVKYTDKQLKLYNECLSLP